ncbi:hypothetical protein P154DRAFT_326647 [Amniculicola lignicola CBS 123094]|uniref:WSC domain-containing protein n=1 Tax=Amniculicola lignicola CBS 123094 TaxID=1392246 RepID=A0A6A5W4G0_9PLEO|nr:hypothetical protein P154DRAFT_326647 [Amniculicola lignicola CBS 123094]
MMLLYSSLCVLLAARATWASPAITLPPASIITPAPLIPRAIDYSFIGYEMSGGAAVSTWFCKSQTFTFSSGFAGCALYGYEIVTTCSGTLAIGASNTASCLNYCATHSVYRSQGDKSPAQWIDCAEKPGRLQLFRETVPATSTLFTTTESVPYLPPTFSTSISPSTSPVLASSTAPSSPSTLFIVPLKG